MTHEVVQFLKSEKGVFNISTTESAGKKQLYLSPRKNTLASMQVEAKTLENTIALAFKEKEIGYFIKDGEERYIKLKLNLDKKGEKNFIKEIPIPNKKRRPYSFKKAGCLKRNFLLRDNRTYKRYKIDHH